jgi:hypothetical protein
MFQALLQCFVMAYHVIALTRQQVTGGGMSILDRFSDSMIRSMSEITQETNAIRARGRQIRREQVEVLTLDPLNPHFGEARQRYGGDVFTVLFLNDAARAACNRYGIDADYAAEIQENELPANVGVALRMDDYYVV